MINNGLMLRPLLALHLRCPVYIGDSIYRIKEPLTKPYWLWG